MKIKFLLQLKNLERNRIKYHANITQLSIVLISFFLAYLFCPEFQNWTLNSSIILNTVLLRRNVFTLPQLKTNQPSMMYILVCSTEENWSWLEFFDCSCHLYFETKPLNSENLPCLIPVSKSPFSKSSQTVAGMIFL